MTKNNTCFKDVMGNSPTIKVIEYMLGWAMYDFTVAEISKFAEVSRIKTTEIVKKLNKTGVIKETRRVGRGVFYTFNKQHIISKELIRLFKIIVKNNIKNQNIYKH